jgi:hypothetical protein
MAEKGPEQSGDGSGIVNRLRERSGGRSSFVYIVVGVVAITLTLLLAIIYFSASERERTSPPICTDISMEDAESAVLRGEAERLTIVYDEATQTPSSHRYGPVLAKLDYIDGTCSNLPQGVANQEVVYTIAGIIAFYNVNTEGQQVETIYQTSDRLSADLFATPTEPATEAPTAIPTEPPTPAATEPATAPPIGTPRPEGSPIASPAASPQSTVIASP